jgi:hypothetical protein
LIDNVCSVDPLFEESSDLDIDLFLNEQKPLIENALFALFHLAAQLV